MNAVDKATVNVDQNSSSVAAEDGILARLGSKPTFAWLQVCALKIDSKYQRRTDEAHVKNLAAKFCYAHLAPLVVVDNGDGTYNIVDGQHRWKAAKRVKQVPLLPCLIHDRLDLQQQATAFVAHNAGRKKVGPLTIFHAKVVAKDPVAMGVARACQAAGAIIPRAHRKAAECKPNETAAIGILAHIFKSYDDTTFAEEQIVEVLRVLLRAYPNKSGQLSASMIRAVWQAVDKDFKPDEIVAALKTTCDADLQLEGPFAVSEDETKNVRDAICAALLEKIERGRAQ